jgi:hypothetical protein
MHMNITTRSQVLAFAFLCAVSILFWWHPLVATLGLAQANDAYTHILLILPLSGALIYLDWKVFRLDPAPSPRVGAALLALALLIGVYARWGSVATPDDVRLSLAMFAFVIWLLASVLLCFGARTFQSFLFPLCFLFLIVPIPQFALRWIVEFLQQQSASAARIMFRAVGVPATQDGIMLSIPGLDIEVARECSSIRSQSDAIRHHHGFGASIPALMVAEGVDRCGGNSAVGGEERVAHLHDRGTRNASGPGVPHGEAPSSWRDSLLRSLSGRGGRAAMDPAANGAPNPVGALG